MPYTINDKRGQDKAEVKEACRICGSSTVHSRDYNRPTMGCIEHLRSIIASLEETITQTRAWYADDQNASVHSK